MKISQQIDENREAIEAMILVMDKISKAETCQAGVMAVSVKVELQRLLEECPPTPPTPEEKPGPVLLWTMSKSFPGFLAESARGGSYALAFKAKRGKWNVLMRADELAKGTLQECMQACEDHEAKLPEAPKLKSGYYWYDEAMYERRIAYIHGDGSYIIFNGSNGDTELSANYTENTPGTFKGPLEEPI